MKKTFYNNNRLIISVLLIAVLATSFMLCVGFGGPSVAYAYDGSDTANSDEIYYAGTGEAQVVEESFAYATKSNEYYLINSNFPSYFNTDGSLLNTCANVAGANIIGYYDRYFENLIPNVTPGIETSKYLYYPMAKNTKAFQAVINELYQRMKTNVNNAGSTQPQYKNGLNEYVQARGLTSSFSSVMSNGQFDLGKAKAQFQSGRPISLYLSGYGFTEVKDDGSTVSLRKYLYGGNHIAIAYGYEKVTYYNASGQIIKTNIYLRVSTGTNGLNGVYIINNYGVLNDAEAVYIGQ